MVFGADNKRKSKFGKKSSFPLWLSLLDYCRFSLRQPIEMNVVKQSLEGRVLIFEMTFDSGSLRQYH